MSGSHLSYISEIPGYLLKVDMTDGDVELIQCRGALNFNNKKTRRRGVRSNLEKLKTSRVIIRKAARASSRADKV